MKLLFNIIKGIVKLALWIFCIFLIAIIFIQRFTNNTVTFLGYRIFNVATESMVPKYNVGDILIIKTIDPNNIKVGDDITYMGEVDTFKDRIVTHQVIKIEDKKDESGELIFHTKGIANPSEDPTIKSHQIYGKVLYKFIVLSYFSGIINNMYGMYILLIASIAVVIIMEIRDYKKMDEEDEEINELKDEKNSKNNKIANKMREKRKKRQQKQQKKEI